jgi:hypothetical protein
MRRSPVLAVAFSGYSLMEVCGLTEVVDCLPRLGVDTALGVLPVRVTSFLQQF